MRDWEKAIVQWLALGETGLSSEAIAFTALGVEGHVMHHPHDPSDLWRCLKLLETVPVAKKGIAAMAKHSDVWARLYSQWNKLERHLKSEIGDDLPKYGWAAPQTYAYMRNIINPSV